MNGLRLGTPEIARLGMTASDMPTLAGFIAGGLDTATDHTALAQQVSEWRSQFSEIHFTADRPS